MRVCRVERITGPNPLAVILVSRRVNIRVRVEGQAETRNVSEYSTQRNRSPNLDPFMVKLLHYKHHLLQNNFLFRFVVSATSVPPTYRR